MTHWPFRRVLLFCLGWIVAVPLLALVSVVASAWIGMRSARADQPASGGYIVAFSVGTLAGWPLVALLLGPPLVVVAIWLYGRLRRR